MATEAMTTPSMAITVVFSDGPRSVLERVLHVPTGCTALDALVNAAQAWGISTETLQELHLGVWGKRVAAQHRLEDGDRLELYRPLKVDPKVARRERFVRQGSKGAGLFAKRRAGGKAGY